MRQENGKNMERLKQGVMLCLLSWGVATHAGPVKSFAPEMVTIPAGKFMMGSPPNDPDWGMVAGPRHQVTIAKPFAVGKYEVTFAEWDYCVADGGCNGYKPDDKGWGRGNRPAINVSWNDAQAYIAWLNKKTGQQFRLLSEAEWEYAARAGTTTTYYWGNRIGQNNANCTDCGSQYGGEQTAPVGSFKSNAFGLYDMLGNVWEWTEDIYHDSYNGAPANGGAWLSGEAGHVLRGGSWNYDSVYIHTAGRDALGSDSRSDHFGFRLARTLP